MKQLSSLLSAIIFLIALNSCCTKRGCPGLSTLNGIEFHNFTPEGVDTVVIYSFTKNTGFSSALDSFVTQARPNDTYFVAHTMGLDINRDYKVSLPGIGQVYTLTEFEIGKMSCNKCFPPRLKKDEEEYLSGYKLNGEEKPGTIIRIGD